MSNLTFTGLKVLRTVRLFPCHQEVRFCGEFKVFWMFDNEFRFKGESKYMSSAEDQTIPWPTWPVALTIIRGKATEVLEY
jgi:hypothetical protein